MLLKKKNLKVCIHCKDKMFYLFVVNCDSFGNHVTIKDFLGRFDSVKQYLKFNDSEYIKLNSLLSISHKYGGVTMFYNAVLLEE